MILVCFGTRPEWLKVKSLINKLTCKLLFTGQHKDLVKDIKVDFTIHQNARGNRLDDIILNCLNQFPNDSTIDSVLVQGDTASAFACALAAFHRGLKIIHLEAGLRSFDLQNPFPEEGYRQMISRIADVHLCPTELSKTRLLEEGCLGLKEVVGNTVLDNIAHLRDDVTYDNLVLVTLHRRENHEVIADWFNEIEQLAVDNPTIKFILPIHPNPNVQKHKNLLRKVEVVDALPHNELVKLLQHCLLTITDSGGIQEEATFLKKKSIVCRTVTERPEAVNHLYLCKNPSLLKKVFYRVLECPRIGSPCPYGDGKSSDRIKIILHADYNAAKEKS